MRVNRSVRAPAHSASSIRPGAATPDRFEHHALLYRDDQEYVAGVGQYVRQGLDCDEAVVVALPFRQSDLLRSALAEDASHVQFLEMERIGANPARIIDRWQRVVDDQAGLGRRLRGVGEPAWPGRRDAELLECQLHELLINRAFGAGVAWRLLCPYDALNLPSKVTEAVGEAHPGWWDGTAAPGSRPSDTYRHDGAIEIFAADLPARPPDAVIRTYHDSGELAAVRNTVRIFAEQSRLAREQIDNVVLASCELATNSIRHAGGRGTLAMWRDADSVVIEFTDDGHITDLLVGRLSPGSAAMNGRGVYLANQLCDLVQIRSSAAGTTIRILTWTTPPPSRT